MSQAQTPPRGALGLLGGGVGVEGGWVKMGLPCEKRKKLWLGLEGQGRPKNGQD